MAQHVARRAPRCDAGRHASPERTPCPADGPASGPAAFSSLTGLAQTAHSEERIRKRLLSGASSEKLAPRPGTTSTSPLRVRPALELLAVHPELAAGDLADLLVDAAQLEFAHLESTWARCRRSSPRRGET